MKIIKKNNVKTFFLKSGPLFKTNSKNTNLKLGFQTV